MDTIFAHQAELPFLAVLAFVTILLLFVLGIAAVGSKRRVRKMKDELMGALEDQRVWLERQLRQSQGTDAQRARANEIIEEPS